MIWHSLHNWTRVPIPSVDKKPTSQNTPYPNYPCFPNLLPFLPNSNNLHLFALSNSIYLPGYPKRSALHLSPSNEFPLFLILLREKESNFSHLESDSLFLNLKLFPHKSMPSTYWCHRCNRFVRVSTQDSVNCPDCTGGFVEEIETPTRSSLFDSRRRRFPAAAMYMSPRLRRSRRNGGDRSPFNPVIVLRGSNDAGGGGGGFELYYDDEAGSGLRPLPPSMSEFLLGSGFDRVLDQLAQIEVNAIGRIDTNPPASKAAIESMLTIDISDEHVSVELYCAICKEAFEVGAEAREMPCKHLYHQDCILPWLSLRNSCPVCRHEMPTDSENVGDVNDVVNDDETVGLTIWRLPGGGFAVGRFAGGRELPVVYTEMDGSFNGNGLPRRISWGSRAGISRESGRVRRVLNRLLACFGSSTSSSSSDSLFSSTSRQRRGWEE